MYIVNTVSVGRNSSGSGCSLKKLSYIICVSDKDRQSIKKKKKK